MVITADGVCALLVLGALVIPFIAYVAAKLAGYGWMKGQWQFMREQMRFEGKGEEEGPESKGT